MKSYKLIISVLIMLWVVAVTWFVVEQIRYNQYLAQTMNDAINKFNQNQ